MITHFKFKMWLLQLYKWEPTKLCLPYLTELLLLFFLTINGRDNSLYSLHKFKKLIRKKNCLPVSNYFLQKRSMGKNITFSNVGLKQIKKFYKCWNIKKRSYNLFSMKMSSHLFFLFWRQNGSWPLPLLLPPYLCQNMSDLS